MLESKVQLVPPTKNIIMAVLTPKSVIQLAFETGRKLNSVCYCYVHFFTSHWFLSFKREVFPSILSNNSYDQIFDNNTDCKCYVKNLLRFFDKNIARACKQTLRLLTSHLKFKFLLILTKNSFNVYFNELIQNQ